MTQTHTCTYRVSYGDTDRMDRVYYANYLEICERARTEYLRAVGYPYREIEAKGNFFPVRSCQIRYFDYAVYDDELICETRISRMRHATLAFTTDIRREAGAKPLVTATIELACVDRSGKPCVIPDALRAAVEQYVEK